ncbi:hypothetical protein EDC52_101794 [Biostraticola tofi]|uniref:ParB/Spo0J HTH domain-containing protein n=2 Tax=Biostraticola tofi TaxID=466109 RepID=A0A4R3Z3N6_9GAMM|nr:hypothetical protein EDC52_101794 [Biostraticola tofi]
MLATFAMLFARLTTSAICGRNSMGELNNMAVNSFKKMRTESVIKRTDSGMQIRLSDIHVKPGFNKRDDDERTRQADDELFTFLMAGGIVPALEVQARDEGGVWVIEGHRRQRVYLRCVEAGKPIEWISITPFTGNDVERLARIMTSNNQLPLTQLEQAAVVKELAAFNLTPDEIAKIINKSRATVDKLLILSRSNHDVQMLVKEGSVAVDVAVDRVRKEGESAGESLAVDVEKAKAAGKTKVTKSIAQPQFSAKLARRLVELLYDAPAELFAGVNGSEEIQSILQAYREGR